ncbi:MAG: hypothetical protein ACRD3P_06920 [Terriglobales bacterium]
MPPNVESEIDGIHANPAERNKFQSEIRAAELALVYYQALELEKKVG